MEMSIDNMSLEDYGEVLSIFREGVDAGDLVMESDDPAGMNLASGRNLVARAGGKVVGWAVVQPADDPSRATAASVSVFVKPDYRRIGVGRALLDAAAGQSARSGITALLTGIVPQNVPALLLHKSCGFRAIGMLQKAGVASGKLRDAVLLQRNCG
ncbi:MAG: GNAT family N-acetyltransferase [Methanocella sp.]